MDARDRKGMEGRERREGEERKENEEERKVETVSGSSQEFLYKGLEHEHFSQLLKRETPAVGVGVYRYLRTFSTDPWKSRRSLWP